MNLYVTKFEQIALPKEKFQLPNGWNWKGDWDIAPDMSLLYEKDAGHTQYLEEVYEQNKRNLPGSSWDLGFKDKKPYHWTDFVKIEKKI